jgi:hypothetical protein
MHYRVIFASFDGAAWPFWMAPVGAPSPRPTTADGCLNEAVCLAV